MKQGLSNFIFHAKRLFHVYLFGLFVFLIIRLVFFLRIAHGHYHEITIRELFHAFYVGAKFDTMVLMYGSLIPMVFTITTMFIDRKSYLNFVNSFSRFYLFIILTLFFILLVIDIFYYDYFQSHINILFFGFFEDDTKAVMKSVWTDYPLIRVVLVLLTFMVILYYLLKKIYSKWESIDILPSGKGSFGLTVVILALFFMGMRGSLGTFPLQIDDVVISSNPIINLLPMNGVFAVKEAMVMRKKQMNIEGNINWLRQIGYANQAEAVRDNFKLPADNFSLDSIRHYYFARTVSSDFLKKNPPHVIFFQMESMSNYNMNYHSDQLNLLGSLEPFWKSEIVFRKCLPYGNGTINTLEGLLVNTPVTSLAQSDKRFVNYSSSIALPFKQAGYQTTYVTGGKLGWRNIDEFIPNQYFDHVAGNASITDAVPGTKACEWGVYDEYLFDYVFKQLQESHGKPQMVFAMTTTNHTPFELPDHYKPYAVNIPESLNGKLETDLVMAKKNFTNLQYSNDCLGKFLEKLKASPFAENTIVAATGDHNNLMLFDFRDEEILEKRGVPLFMYIPKAYREGLMTDTSLFVSHRDIFPTLINLSLSETNYFNGGNFLFSKADQRPDYFAIDLMSKESVSTAGAVQFDPDPTFFKWNENKTVLTKTTTPDQALDSLLKKSRAYYASMSYFIKSEIDRKNRK